MSSKLLNIEDVSAYFVANESKTLTVMIQSTLTNLPLTYLTDGKRFDRQRKLARELEKAIRKWEIEIDDDI